MPQKKKARKRARKKELELVCKINYSTSLSCESIHKEGVENAFNILFESVFTNKKNNYDKKR